MTFKQILLVQEIYKFSYKYKIYTIDVFSSIREIPKAIEDIDKFLYNLNRPIVTITTKIIDIIYSYNITNAIQKAFLNFLQAYSLVNSQYIIKTIKDLAKYNQKNTSKVYIPSFILQHRVAYNSKSKLYIGFLFSTIIRTNITINIYKAIASAIYIYILYQ